LRDGRSADIATDMVDDDSFVPDRVPVLYERNQATREIGYVFELAPGAPLLGSDRVQCSSVPVVLSALRVPSAHIRR
jgi:hypothetical protein